VETTLALILMGGTGLMLKSFLRVTRADPGFDPNHVLTANVSAPESKYKEPAQRRMFIEQVVSRVQAIPGVQAAASALPLLGGWQSGFTIAGRPEPSHAEMPSADVTRISPDYAPRTTLTRPRCAWWTRHSRKRIFLTKSRSGSACASGGTLPTTKTRGWRSWVSLTT
jgi:hypothetical protein